MKKAKPDMKVLRGEIDRVDGALLDLIAERMELARAVRAAKSGVDVWRPSREESHVRDLAGKAGGTSPELVSRIWAELTSASLTLQGPIRLHIALVGEDLATRALVRDRFGAAIPANAYPTASAALAAAHSDPEGVAVLPAPGGMNTWWTALGPDGAAADMHILAALPRIGVWDWPTAVALSKAALMPSGADETLVYCEPGPQDNLRTPENVFEQAGLQARLRAEMDGKFLYSIDAYLDEQSPAFVQITSAFKRAKIIGVLPRPISVPTGEHE